MDKDMPVTFYTLLDEGLTEVYLESIRESDGQCEITVDLGDDPRYRKGHADGVQEIKDYMMDQVGYCNFGE
jgi:hypothetical protein